jgi:hypothetical protein
MFGMYALVILAPLSILVEAVVLRLLLPRARSFWRSLGCSLLMNLTSGLLGVVWVYYAASWLFELNERTGGSYYVPSPEAERVLLPSVVLYWALSVVIEGIILMLLEKGRYHPGRTWAVCLAANVLSYVALFVLFPILR